MTTEPETDDSSPAGWPLWQPPPGLPEPARQVWLAGLGAFSRAQAEGGKAFEALVRQGLTLQTQASQAAQARIAEAAQPWEHLSGLSDIFEDRVARALAHLGLPSAHDWAALQARVRALEAALPDAPSARHAGAPAPSAAARPTAKSATKSTAQSPAAVKKPAARSSAKPRAQSGPTKRISTRTPSRS
ncbi:MAG: phasin family protein [Burkholderiaceae bacterium]|jgi:poly(hydroxyalkanoate) granule-associated protein|nr:phasin family protein [Burkholderiaceae bacterium]